MADPLQNDRARLLLVASRWLVVVPIIFTTLLMTAGTFLFPDYHRPTVLGLGLKSLAMVSYDGILPLNSTGIPTDIPTPPGTDRESNYFFTLHKFHNAFSWECPRCPPVIYSPSGMVELAGVSQTGPSAGANPLNLMLHIADLTSGHDNTSFQDCYSEAPRSPDQECPKSQFFETWGHNFHDFWMSGVSDIPLSFFINIMCLLLAVAVLVNEALIAYAPRHMRCRCLCLRRWCPYPDGAPEDVEVLPEHRWNRVRLFTYPLVFQYYFLAAVHDSLQPRFMLTILEFIDRRFPEGLSMRPTQNTPYLLLIWGSVCCTGLALACVSVRYHLGKDKGHISLDDLAAYEPGSGPADTSVISSSAAATDSASTNTEDDADETSESQTLLTSSQSDIESGTDRVAI